MNELYFFQFKLFWESEFLLLFAYLPHRLVRIWFCLDALLLRVISVHLFGDFQNCVCLKCACVGESGGSFHLKTFFLSLA